MGQNSEMYLIRYGKKMIDPRFDTRPESYIQKLRNTNQNAKEYLNGLSETLDVLQEDIVKWWNSLGEKRGTFILGRLSKDQSPTMYLKKGPADLLAALHRISVKGVSEESWEDMAGSILIGRAMGKFLASHPSKKLFFQTTSFLEINHPAWDELLSSFGREIGQSPALKKRWIRLFQNESIKLENFIDRGLSLETLEELKRKQDCRTNLDEFSCWNKYYQNFMTLNLFQLAKKLDFLSILEDTTFLNFIERLPLHEIIQTILMELRFSHDQNLIRQLIKNASSAYDSKGIWTKKIVSVFIPQLIMKYADSLENSIRYITQQQTEFIQAEAHQSDLLNVFYKEELPNWFRKVFGDFLKREDGELILKKFLIFLVGSQINANDFNGPGNPTLIAINVLGELFQSKQIGFSWIQDWKGEGTEKEYSALLVYCILEKEKPIHQWDWYIDLLKKRKSELSLGVSAFSVIPDWIGNLIGSCLMELQNPLDLFRDAWIKLYSERLSARFRVNHGELISSMNLLEIGKGVLRCLLSDIGSHPRDPDLAKKLWGFLYQSYEFIYLSFSFRKSQPILREFITLFAYIPIVFKESWKEAIHQSADLLCVDVGFAAYAFKSISQNGINNLTLSESIIEIFGGVKEFVSDLEVFNRCSFKIYPEFFSYNQLIEGWKSLRS